MQFIHANTLARKQEINIFLISHIKFHTFNLEVN